MKKKDKITYVVADGLKTSRLNLSPVGKVYERQIGSVVAIEISIPQGENKEDKSRIQFLNEFEHSVATIDISWSQMKDIRMLINALAKAGE